MRLKVQTLKSLLWVANAVVGAAIVALLLYLVLHVRVKAPKEHRLDQKTLDAVVAVKPSIETRERTAGVNWPELENLHKLNITGKDPPPPPTPEDVNPNRPPPLKPIEEVLVIKNIWFDGGGTGTRVYLHYLEDGQAG